MSVSIGNCDVTFPGETASRADGDRVIDWQNYLDKLYDPSSVLATSQPAPLSYHKVGSALRLPRFSLRRSRKICTSMLHSKTSSCTHVACSKCSRLSGRCRASSEAVNRAYSPLVSETATLLGSVRRCRRRSSCQPPNWHGPRSACVAVRRGPLRGAIGGWSYLAVPEGFKRAPLGDPRPGSARSWR
jgi:hypothetical protein